MRKPMAVYVEGTKQSFDKGVAMHAPAELGVNLEGKGVSRFTARIGISADQTLGNKADVNYVIKGDGKELYRKDHVISNGQSYLVDIDVSKVKRSASDRRRRRCRLQRPRTVGRCKIHVPE